MLIHWYIDQNRLEEALLEYSDAFNIENISTSDSPRDSRRGSLHKIREILLKRVGKERLTLAETLE